MNHEGDLHVYRKGVVGPCDVVEGFFKPDDKPIVRTTSYCTRAGEPVIVLIGAKRKEPFEGFRIVISRIDGKMLFKASYIEGLPKRSRTCR